MKLVAVNHWTGNIRPKSMVWLCYSDLQPSAGIPRFVVEPRLTTAVERAKLTMTFNVHPVDHHERFNSSKVHPPLRISADLEEVLQLWPWRLELLVLAAQQAPAPAALHRWRRAVAVAQRNRCVAAMALEALEALGHTEEARTMQRGAKGRAPCRGGG